MKKIMIVFALLVWMAGAALADTLYLRDGGVIKGRLIGYEDGQFTFAASGGNQTNYSVRLVLRLEIDRDTRSGEARYRRFPLRDVDNLPSSAGSIIGRLESALPFDVRLEDQWTHSQIQVYRGQRVRVQATGTVTLEGRTPVSPEGLRNKQDYNAPMPSGNDGALIAVIGKDANSPLIMIGRQQEFVADRAGTLYFSVNHGETRNSAGAFRVSVAVDRGTGVWSRASTNNTQMREKTITVPANQAWTDTGIDLEYSETIEISAEGEIKLSRDRVTGPDGDRNANASTSIYPIQTSGVGAVIAKICYPNGGESGLFFIGSRNQMRTGSNDYGRLFIGINDDVLRDNSGSYQVTIRW